MSLWRSILSLTRPYTCLVVPRTDGKLTVFSSSGRSPGRAIVIHSALPLAAAAELAKSFLRDGQGTVRRAILSL